MSEIRIRNNGPLLVKSTVALKDAEGNEYNLEGKDQYALCRCGKSATAPFCDGAHRDGFSSECSAT